MYFESKWEDGSFPSGKMVSHFPATPTPYLPLIKSVLHVLFFFKVSSLLLTALQMCPTCAFNNARLYFTKRKIIFW